MGMSCIKSIIGAKFWQIELLNDNLEQMTQRIRMADLG